MRCFLHVPNIKNKLSLEDDLFAQLLFEETTQVYLDDVLYSVCGLEKRLLRAGNGVDGEIHIYLQKQKI